MGNRQWDEKRNMQEKNWRKKIQAFLVVKNKKR